MSILDGLILTDTVKKQVLPPHVAIRQRLAEAIDQQVAALASEAAGQPFVKQVERYITDPTTGERTKTQVNGKFRRWYWTDTTGKTNLEIRYANRALELKAGKRVVEIASADQIVPTLEKIKAAVVAGELDKSLNAALTLRRKELKGNKPKAA